MAHLSRAMPKILGRLRQAGATRLATVIFVLVAFTSQAIVTQTHIHLGTRPGAASTLPGFDDQLAGKPLPAKLPFDDNPNNCPICQGLFHAGSYLTPSLAVLVSLTVVGFITALHAEYVAIAQPHSHGWKSRAPPLA